MFTSLASPILLFYFHFLVKSDKKLFQFYMFHNYQSDEKKIKAGDLRMKLDFKTKGISLSREFVPKISNNQTLVVSKINIILIFQEDDKFVLNGIITFNRTRYNFEWIMNKNLDDRIIKDIYNKYTFIFFVRILVININPENPLRLISVKLSTRKAVNLSESRFPNSFFNIERKNKKFIIFQKSWLQDKYLAPNVFNQLIKTLLKETNNNHSLLLERIDFKSGNNYIFSKQFDNSANVKNIKSYVRFQQKKFRQIIVYIDYFCIGAINHINSLGVSIFNKKVKYDTEGELICKDPSKKGVSLCEAEIDKSLETQCLNKGKYLSIITNLIKKITCDCSEFFFGRDCQYFSKCFNILLDRKTSRCVTVHYQTGDNNPYLEEIHKVKKCTMGSYTKINNLKNCSLNLLYHMGINLGLHCENYCPCKECEYKRGNIICKFFNHPIEKIEMKSISKYYRYGLLAIFSILIVMILVIILKKQNKAISKYLKIKLMRTTSCSPSDFEVEYSEINTVNHRNMKLDEINIVTRLCNENSVKEVVYLYESVYIDLENFGYFENKNVDIYDYSHEKTKNNKEITNIDINSEEFSSCHYHPTVNQNDYNLRARKSSDGASHPNSTVYLFHNDPNKIGKTNEIYNEFYCESHSNEP